MSRCCPKDGNRNGRFAVKKRNSRFCSAISGFILCQIWIKAETEIITFDSKENTQQAVTKETATEIIFFSAFSRDRASVDK